MKYLFLLLICFTYYPDCFSQEHAFKISFHPGNTFVPEIDTIDYQRFEKIKAIGFQSVPLSAAPGQNIDSLVKAIDRAAVLNKIRMDSVVKGLAREFAGSFKEKDSCLTLNGKDKQILICKNRNQNDIQAWSEYHFSDYQKGYLVLEHYLYEGWEYVLFNPRTRNYKFAHYAPVFVNDSVIYTTGNYYSEGGFQFMQITGDLYFGFETYNWELRECYRVNNVFYFYFRSNLSQAERTVYLKISFEKLL